MPADPTVWYIYIFQWVEKVDSINSIQKQSRIIIFIKEKHNIKDDLYWTVWIT